MKRLEDISEACIITHSTIEKTDCCGCLIGSLENLHCNECGKKFELREK